MTGTAGTVLSTVEIMLTWFGIVVVAGLLAAGIERAMKRLDQRDAAAPVFLSAAVGGPTTDPPPTTEEEAGPDPRGSGLAGDDDPVDAVPTLREERVILYGLEYPHVCLPDCPDVPVDGDGPVIQGRRCVVCGGPDGPECGVCFVREDAVAARRADR